MRQAMLYILILLKYTFHLGGHRLSEPPRVSIANCPFPEPGGEEFEFSPYPRSSLCQDVSLVLILKLPGG